MRVVEVEFGDEDLLRPADPELFTLALDVVDEVERIEDRGFAVFFANALARLFEKLFEATGELLSESCTERRYVVKKVEREEGDFAFGVLLESEGDDRAEKVERNYRVKALTVEEKEGRTVLKFTVEETP